MTVRIYKSTDASAPVLTGQAGAMLTVLDAVLVNGYGALTAAGWTKPFTASGNIGIYRMATSGNSGFYLHVDDSGTNNTAKETMLVGAEGASALNTITAQFPTAAQINLFASTPTGGLMARKSSTADATARSWIIVADGSVIYMWIDPGDFTSPAAGSMWMFGDIFSYAPGDPYKCMLIGRNLANSNSATQDAFGQLQQYGVSDFLQRTIPGHFIARHWNQVAGSVPVGKHTDYGNLGCGGTTGSSTGTTAMGGGTQAAAMGWMFFGNGQTNYPHGPDGGLWMAPTWIHHGLAVRGYLKGIWCPLMMRAFNHGDTFSGAGNLSGKSFIALDIYTGDNGAGRQGQVFVEYSDTWS